MTLGQFLLLYMMIGLGVGVASYLSARRVASAQVLTATLFWPLSLPLLLSARSEPDMDSLEAPVPNDTLASTITQVDAELEGALHSLDGWAEGVLAREKDRLHELRMAWRVQAQRIREMDRFLSRPSANPLDAEPSLSERMRLSQDVIEKNRRRLQEVRERSYQDLMGTLAWVRELVSMIHLAKFTGAPASRAEELVAQVAASVEGISTLMWHES